MVDRSARLEKSGPGHGEIALEKRGDRLFNSLGVVKVGSTLFFSGPSFSSLLSQGSPPSSYPGPRPETYPCRPWCVHYGGGGPRGGGTNCGFTS